MNEDDFLEEAYEDRFVEPDLDDFDSPIGGGLILDGREDEDEDEDPNPLDADIEKVAQSLVYGGEGENMNAPRRLIAFVELPDRRKETWQARNLLMESDIREAMALGAVKLHRAFMQRDYGNIGYVFNPEDIEYDFTRLAIGMDVGADTSIKHTEGLARVIVATVLIKRA